MAQRSAWLRGMGAALAAHHTVQWGEGKFGGEEAMWHGVGGADSAVGVCGTAGLGRGGNPSSVRSWEHGNMPGVMWSTQHVAGGMWPQPLRSWTALCYSITISNFSQPLWQHIVRLINKKGMQERLDNVTKIKKQRIYLSVNLRNNLC